MSTAVRKRKTAGTRKRTYTRKKTYTSKKKKNSILYKYRRIIIAAVTIVVITALTVTLAIFQKKQSIKQSNERVIFEFLTDKMGLNTAAACGVLANIEQESGFHSDNMEKGYTWSQGAGYGICQWTNYPREAETGRRTELVDWCVENGYDYKTLSGQLEFLKYELTSNPAFTDSVTDKLRKVPDTAEGAYQAGYCWCYYFEVPEGYDEGVSETRGETARDNYWARYCKTEEA